MTLPLKGVVPAIALWMVCGSLAQGQGGWAPEPLVKQGAAVKLGEHTWAIPDGNLGGVPNVGIVVGTRATLVIDPGMGRRNGEIVLREAARLGRRDALYIASTHFHPEHTTGYVAFPASAQYINSRVQEAEFAESGMEFVAMFASRSLVQAGLLKDARRRVADITFDKDYLLDLGGVRVRMLLAGPTHTKGDTGFFVESDDVLFAGDVVMNQSFVAANAAITSIRAWLSAFDAFEAMRPRTIVPAHGPIGPPSLIPTLRAVMQDIQARAHALKAQGRSADEVATALQAEMQAKYPTWARLNGVAAAARAAYNEPAAAGQTGAARVSVWDGVYTAAEAARGQEAYNTACSACHGRDLKGVRDNRALVGDRFWQDWGEDSLGTLFSVVKRTMPRNAAGSLPDQDYLDIVAYVLQQNGYPQGSRELAAASIGEVWVMRKEGPGPVPNFSMVWVVGCLARESDRAWVLTRTTEPVKTRNPAPSEGSDLERVSGTALGAETFDLMDFVSKHAEFAGRRVEAKGLLIRGPHNKLNLTSMQPLSGDCPQ